MELREAIEKRSAVRAFKAYEIEDEDIRDMAYLASRAPSCANNQPWNFVFVRDREKLASLHQALTGGNYWAKNASVIVAVFSKKESDCMVAGRDYYLLGTGMALAHLMLAAVAKGLAAHPMAGFDEKQAKDSLHLPEDMQLITLVAVGKQSDDLSSLSEKHKTSETQRSARKSFEEFAWVDEYK